MAVQKKAPAKKTVKKKVARKTSMSDPQARGIRRGEAVPRSAVRVAAASSPATDVNAVEPVTRRRPPTRELGGTGTIFNDGFQIFDDINPDWRDLTRRNRMIDTMRRTDGSVQSSLSSCKLPILASRWIMQPPDDATDEERDHAAFAQECLHSMDTSWPATLTQILTNFEFGHSVFEKVYRSKVVNGKERWIWKDWAPRMQSTISAWNADDAGHLISVEQSVWKGNRYVDATMSADRLLIFTIGQEGSNFQGTSLLRSAYKHWYIKDGLYRIDAIAQERHGVGIPVIKTPRDSSSEDDDIVEQIVMNLRSHEKAFLVLPEGYDVSMMEFKTQMRDPLASIKHHDEKIAQNVLAQFIMLGFSTTGSNALGSSMSQFFMSSLNYYTSLIAGVINRDAIRELINVNFGPLDDDGNARRYPRLECVPIGGLDFAKMAQSAMMLRQGGLIRPTRATVEHFHQMLGIPKPNWKEPAIEVEGPGVNRAGMTGKKPSTSNNKQVVSKPKEDQNPEEKKAAKKIKPAIRLQISSLLKQAKSGEVVMFKPPLEGTLKEAVLMAVDGLPIELVERVTREFSRRLCSTAEITYRTPNAPDLKTALENEAERSMELIFSIIRSAPVEAA